MNIDLLTKKVTIASCGGLEIPISIRAVYAAAVDANFAFVHAINRTEEPLVIPKKGFVIEFDIASSPAAEKPLLIGGTANSETVAAEGVTVYGNNEQSQIFAAITTRSMISGRFINHSMSDDSLITPASYYFPHRCR